MSFIVYQRSSSSNLYAPNSLSLALYQHRYVLSALSQFDLCTELNLAVSDPSGIARIHALRKADAKG
jgi:hypothetical protein